MEFNIISNNLHIEFYGLPGCGKSTISELIARKYENRGYEVIRASAETGNEYNKFYRILKKSYRGFLYYLSNPHEMSSIYKLVSENGYKRISDRIKQLVNVVQKVRYYQLPYHNSVFIWDEGIVQASVSLSINNMASTNYNLRFLESLCNNTDYIAIYIRESIETCLSRMESRATNNSRVEKEENRDKKIDLMKLYLQCCDEIRAKKIIIVDCDNNSPQEVAAKVWKELNDAL